VRKVDVLDILGREPVEPSLKLLNKNIKDKNILITGAGGSIGTELCKQIMKLSPNRIVILDHSEFAVYKINNLLKDLTDIQVIPVLTSVVQFEQILFALKKYEINTIYHAAAYKHVPMVELNPFDGIRNNILGTHTLVRAAMQCEIETFILISTDKAVRPTNVMGATKRFSELILQAAQDESTRTCFSMVRFGNVLDSAGSVVPLFRKQIKSGGPVTVTSPDVTRYFMSIQEAVQLVIQAGAMAKGGDVFVLDMGEPIKIYDLAQKMIHLSGFEPKTMDNPNGEIEIKVTGLRPGEKLFEELLIGNNVFITDHSQIMQAREVKYSWEKIEIAVQKIVNASKEVDLKLIKTILIEFIDGYKPSIEAFPAATLGDYHQYIKEIKVAAGNASIEGLYPSINSIKIVLINFRSTSLEALTIF
jgi:FlaA1/EpsC-like NDP-sugar epimerase